MLESLRSACRVSVGLLCFSGAVMAATTTTFVGISGGAGQPLQITLPPMTWTVTSAIGFNAWDVFGVGIDLRQRVPDFSGGTSLPGDAADWTSDNPNLVFTPVLMNQYAFIVNSGAVPIVNGVIWFGMGSSANAQVGDRITFAGGTIGNSPRLTTGTYTSGFYDVFLVGANQYPIVSTAADAIPEPGTACLLVIGSGFGWLCRRPGTRRSCP
jgi:hypothetical protein